MAQLDPRIVTVQIQIDNIVKTYSTDYNITAVGTKYANVLQNECEVTIYNLDKASQDYLLTATSPYNLNKTSKTVKVFAGRESYGTALVYTGNIISSSVTQPPDIGIKLKCLTGNFLKSRILSYNQPGIATLNQVSRTIAGNMNLLLNFQATDRNIANFAFVGSALKQVDALSALGGINAFVDDTNLIVKNAFVPLTNSLRVLNADNGMIGIPQFTEQGIKVKYLLDNRSIIGGALQIVSSVYPAINGTYTIYKLGFDIGSRTTPFYYIAEAAFRR